jgi:uncharacterized protein (TIGR02302 family)
MVQPNLNKKRSLTSLSRSLRAKIGLSGLALNFERLAQAFWPCAIVLMLLFSLLIWQVHTAFPYIASLGLYLALLLCFAVYFWKGLRKFSYARHTEAITRLDAGAAGNPVSSLIDTQFIGAKDEGSRELWRLHQHRMEIEAGNVQVHAPHIRLAKRDPWAIRLIVLLFFSSAILFGRANTEQSLMETLQDLASGTTITVASFEAWAEPPGYTGLPMIYLNKLEDGIKLELPQGTRFILRSYGALELEIVSDIATFEEGKTKFTEEATFKISNSGTLILKKGYRNIAQWNIVMIPDAPPDVVLTEEISRTIQGSIQIPYAAKDDYGIVGGSVKIMLDTDKLDRRYGLTLEPENTDPITFDLPIPFNADSSDYEDTAVEDLAKHTWAGLPVIISLSVVDAAGNTAAIEPVHTAMPGKRFFDTLAGALAEQRRDILWNRTNIDRADLILRTLTYLPEDGFPNQRAYLLVRSVIRRIGYTQMRPIEDRMQNDVAETLWRAALLIEDGDLSDAAARLKRAQERLSEAMKNGATDDEIAELMDELRKATDEYLRQLAENAKPQDQQADNQNAQQVSPEMLQEMMDRIQELMEQGRMDEAQALMDQLQQLLENMQITKSDAEGGEKDQKSADGLQDTLREQQELADENFQEMQEEFNRNQEGENQQGQQNQGEQSGKKGGADEGGPQFGGQSDLASRQEALRKLMQQQLDGLTSDDSEAGQAAREALREAERQMGQARDNLEQGLGSEALDNQADAVESLRQGMRKLNEANQQASRGQNRDGQQDSETLGPDGQDPLGRTPGKDRSAQSNGQRLHSGDELRRSKEILEEIRRRSGERSRPQLELDYLDRLLDRF